ISHPCPPPAIFLLLMLLLPAVAQDLSRSTEGKAYQDKLKIIGIVQDSTFSLSLVPGYSMYFYRAAESNSSIGANVSFTKPLASLALEAQVRMSRSHQVYQGLFLAVLPASPATQPQAFDLTNGLWRSDWSGILLEAVYEITWKRFFMKYGPSTGWTWQSLEFSFGPVLMHHLITQRWSATSFSGLPLLAATNAIQSLSSPKIGAMIQAGARFSFGGSPWHWGLSLRLTDLFAPPAPETPEQWRIAAEPAWHQVIFSLHFYVGVLVGARRSTFDSSQPTL
ncbi:MAG: hypothetical protein J0L75_14615, partial [Spirochaetes bacterium]|nr:hypothetical protein [Spirochaetota bacterium]